MKTLTKLLMSFTTLSVMGICALEKPESAQINPETASLQKDVDTAKKIGNLGPIATRARELETVRLKDRFFKLGLKTDKTPAEEEEFEILRAELTGRMKTEIDRLVNNQ